MTEYIGPEIYDSFRRNGTDFMSRMTKKLGEVRFSCPPYTIASVAQSRIINAELSLPDGYNDDVLTTIRHRTGEWVKMCRFMLNKLVSLLRLGDNFWIFNERGNVQPPLNFHEKQSINHLVALVGRMPN